MMRSDQQRRLREAYETFARRAEEIDPAAKEEVDALLKLIHEQGQPRRAILTTQPQVELKSVLSSVIEGDVEAEADDATETIDLTDVPELFDVWQALHEELPEDSTVAEPATGRAEDLFRSRHPREERAETIEVLKDGGLLGSGTYQILDPNWIEASICWLSHIFDRVAFNADGPVIRIPNETSFALLGDWGTGIYEDGCGAQKVRDVVEGLGVDYTVHLGDVYYAGTKEEVRENFLSLWPVGSNGSLALNSNHEMYAGGRGLFEVTLQHEAFSAQESASFFALENDHWVLVGLDTAYHANRFRLYRKGKLDDSQLEFLRQRVEGLNGRRLILMSHHQGLELRGDPAKPLWKQVQGVLQGNPAIWYWGHLHSAVVYAEQDGIQGRCNGHGGMPRGRAEVLDNNDRVLWFEDRKAGDAAVPPRVVNGLAVLRLDGPDLQETFFDEQGCLLWQSPDETVDD